MSDTQDELNADREVTKTFNPEAQIFQPVEVPRKSASPFGASRAVRSPTDGSPFGMFSKHSNVNAIQCQEFAMHEQCNLEFL